MSQSDLVSKGTTVTLGCTDRLRRILLAERSPEAGPGAEAPIEAAVMAWEVDHVRFEMLTPVAEGFGCCSHPDRTDSRPIDGHVSMFSMSRCSPCSRCSRCSSPACSVVPTVGASRRGRQYYPHRCGVTDLWTARY